MIDKPARDSKMSILYRNHILYETSIVPELRTFPIARFATLALITGFEFYFLYCPFMEN